MEQPTHHENEHDQEDKDQFLRMAQSAFEDVIEGLFCFWI